MVKGFSPGELRKYGSTAEVDALLLSAASEVTLALFWEQKFDLKAAKKNLPTGRRGIQMIVVMQKGAAPEQIEAVENRIIREGFKIHRSDGEERTIIGVLGENTKEKLPGMALEALPGVERIVPVLRPFKLAGRDFKPENSAIIVDGQRVGDQGLTVIAGPCAVESEEQVLTTARQVKAAGATMLRGGAFKPRSSPYSFQGLKEEGLKILARARAETGLPIVTEVMDVEHLDLVAEYTDLLQIGARNMQNFYLLREVGKLDKPVLLKRGPSATIEEWILAAEYILAEGNQQVIFCERGIRTFENYTRNTLDLSAVTAIKELSHLPVIVDPSHGTGRWQMVAPMARAAVAAGADGIMVEVHPCPTEALSDGPQSLTCENFQKLMDQLRAMAPIVDRTL